MSKKLLSIICLMLCLSMLLCACSESEAEVTLPPDEEGLSPGQVLEGTAKADEVFTLAYDSEAGMNPISSGSSANTMFSSLIYDSVFVVDENFELSSRVVTSYESADNEWWVFQVNTDLKFSDGENLSAKDVAYSIRRAMQYNYYRGRLDIIYGISALSDESFAITTAYPNSQLPALLNVPVIKEGDIEEKYPLGTGPYKLSETGDSLVLSENCERSANMPIDEIFLADYTETTEKISAFEASLIDIVTNDPTGLYGLGYGSTNETRYYNTTNMHYIGFNMESMFFQNYAYRYAVYYAADRDYLASELMGECGIAATLPLLPTSKLYDKEYASAFEYDLDKCATIFKNANIADHDNDGVLEYIVYGIVVELDIKFIVNSESTPKLLAARQITEALNSLGIKTTLYEMTYEEYIEALKEGEYDMYYGEIKLTPDWDISYLFNTDKDNEMNYSNFADESFYNNFMQYLTADEVSRYDAYQNAVQYVMENAALAPLAFERCEVLTHRGVVSGINATQYDIFNKFENWKINLQ